MIALMVFGVLSIGISEQADESLDGYAAKQMLFGSIALIAFLAATILPYHRIGRAAYVLFGVTLAVLVLLAAVRYFDYSTSLIPKKRGAFRWINLGIVLVQPSEIAKLAYIILLAWYLRRGDHYRRLRGLIVPFVLTFLPMGLILYEPDLGTSLLFLPTLYVMLFMAGAKLRHLLAIIALATAVLLFPVPRRLGAEAFEDTAEKFTVSRLGPVKFYSLDTSLPKSRRPDVPVAYCRYQIGGGRVYDLQPLSLRVMKDHQRRRIEGWLRQNDPRVAVMQGFQLDRSKMTLASGKLAGRSGWADATFCIRMLPDDHTDFIFSVIGGQWGFLGCLSLLSLYGVILLFGVEIAVITYDPFGRLLTVGVLALLLSQVCINVGMTMGLMPITGMTLPLVSYGGSSLVVNCAAIGLLVNVAQRRPILLSQRPFEYGERRQKPPAPYGPFADGPPGR